MGSKLLATLAALSLMLSGCHDTRPIAPTQIVYKVVMPESKYFDGCDIVKLPDPKTLTDAQLAVLINDLVKVNQICHNNNVAIQQYLLKAKEELENKNPLQQPK